MSWVEVRERCLDSPLRARSLFTVRAAISSARSSDAPCSFWLSLMCSYCRARLVPFLTPRGGIVPASFRLTGSHTRLGARDTHGGYVPQEMHRVRGPARRSSTCRALPSYGLELRGC